MSEPKEISWCTFCKNTGVHLCPEVSEPILIQCSNKNCDVTAMQEKLRVAIEWLEKETDCQRLSFRHVRPCSRCDLLAKIKGGE